ncbi:MAG: CBS domain-containing protein [FCB group bacterium]|nr:CBS domain-containing protein [FCB group bacterium]
MTRQTKHRPIKKEKIHELRTFIRRRKRFYEIIQQILSSLKSNDQLFVIIIAVLIGIFAGYIAAGFRLLIQFFQTALWQSGSFVEIVRESPFWMKLLIPAVGLGVVAKFVQMLAPEAKGHGVPEVMEAVALRNGFIRMRVVLIKALASAATIGAGGSVGREGPIVQIGSAFGSAMGQIFQVPQRRMRTFIGCGAAAGIAATFNAPIAGAIFASEIILGDFSVRAIGPIMISSVFGTVIIRSIFGDFPAFIPPIYTMKTPYEIIFYVILGICAGLVGWLFVKTLYKSEDVFDSLKISTTLKGVVGGLIIGVIAIFFPEIMGVGYETMGNVLTEQLPFYLIIILLAAKLFATSITLGAGGSGGVFAPSLFIGSMLGGMIGLLVHTLFPAITASPGAYALVGMAAVVAATTHAPITAILIIFEMTSEYNVILPVMISSILALVITTRMLDGTIYTIKLKRRGVDIHGGADVNIMKQLSISQLKKQMISTIDEKAVISDFMEALSSSSNSIFYVCDEQKKMSGALTTDAFRRYLNRFEELPEHTTAHDMANPEYPSVRDDTPIPEVMRMMTERDIDIIPVLDDQGHVTGQINRQDIIRCYQDLLVQTHSASTLATSMKYAYKHYHEKTEVFPGYSMIRIETPTSFVGKTIGSLKLRSRYNVDILIIRRTNKNKFVDSMPKSTDKLRQEDQLIVFGENKSVEKLLAVL